MLAFVPETSILLAYMAAVIALTLTPGPDMTLFVGKAIGQSRLAGLAAFCGTSTGLIIHTVLVAVGLSALLAASATAFLILKIVGAFYLVYLAAQALRHGSALSVGGKQAADPIGKVYLKGLAINLLNPKVIIFFLTFLPQFVSPADPHAAGKLMFLGVFFVIVATPISLVMIWFAGSIAHFLKGSPRATRAVDWLFASVMGAFAVRLILAHGK
ncbi:LysE family translocator [Kaistia dalseonensis]|uniref:Threonine/homoserine/homoserine lactone efflux protein n=1 Tax=Kaistia dalseonensis TaxID=410840 RepID=A0ABU0H7J9_9HYPH|nr:LysE family translocator [Kaistia dalseonensis]MCX5495683.1 LysE family translocator [Kaistia dalseonensis]MDQ0438279.1 threonine/homoserine/homoserine lactone efflux protein [Kaistia dalseonensis]